MNLLLLLLIAVTFPSALNLSARPQTAPPTSASSGPELVLQTGHISKIEALAVGDDDKLLASGSADSAIKIWEVTSGRELRSLKGHTKGVTSVAFSRDVRWLISGSNDGSVKLWELSSGLELRTLIGHASSVKSVALSGGGKWAASGGADYGVRLWELSSGREVHSLNGHQSWVVALAFSPDGRMLASGDLSGVVKIWDVAGGRCVRTLNGHKDAVNAVSYSDDNRHIVTGSKDETVKVWDARSGRRKKTFDAPSGAVIAVRADSLKDTVSALSEDRTTYLWELSTGRKIAQIAAATVAAPHTKYEKASFGRDASLVAASGGGRSIEIWRVGSTDISRSLQSHVSGIHSTAVSKDQRWLATGAKDNTIGIWEISAGRKVATLRGHTGWVMSLAFRPNGDGAAERSTSQARQLASGGLDGQIKLWDVASAREVRTFGGQSDSVYCVAFSRNGERLASGSLDKNIRVWDADTGRLLRTLSGHTDEVTSIVFDGAHLISASADATVRVWNINDEDDVGADTASREGQIIATHVDGVYALCLSGDGRLLASAGGDQFIRIWNLANRSLVREIKNPSSGINALSFDESGDRLISAGSDQKVRIWDATTGGLLNTLSGHSEAVSVVVTIAGGHGDGGPRIASSSFDGSTRFWDIRTGRQLIALVCLTDAAEWLAVTPQGLFDGSQKAWDQILWRFSDLMFEVAPVEVFFNEYFYPGLLTEVLSGKEPLPPQDIARLDRRQPQIRLSQLETTGGTAKVKIELTEMPPDNKHSVGSGVKDVRLFRNGTMIKIWRGEMTGQRNGRAVLEAEVPLVSGDNQLTAYAFNRDNVKSASAELNIETSDGALTGDRRAAHILAVGINDYRNPQYDLKYARRDADEFAAEVKRQLESQGSFSRVEVTTLVDREATKANILSALYRLAGAKPDVPRGSGSNLPEGLNRIRKTQPEDTVIIYFAGHGTAHENQFYMIPHDFGYRGGPAALGEEDLRSILRHSISDQELGGTIEELDARDILLVVDACNSGQILESEEKRLGPINSKGLAQLAYEKGMYVLTAAQSYQAALETGKLGHGLLTYTLIEEGLKTMVADAGPTDGQVSAKEWLDYATQRVPRMHESQSRLTRGMSLGGGDAATAQGAQSESSGGKELVQRPRSYYRDDGGRSLIVKRSAAPAKTID